MKLQDNLSRHIKSHKCSKFGQRGLFSLELPALIAEKTIFDLGMLDRWAIVALWATFLLQQILSSEVVPLSKNQIEILLAVYLKNYLS